MWKILLVVSYLVGGHPTTETYLTQKSWDTEDACKVALNSEDNKIGLTNLALAINDRTGATDIKVQKNECAEQPPPGTPA